MRVSEALEQIEAIHGHLARWEVYRGFRAGAVALEGVVALLAAWAQPWLVAAGDARGFVAYWSLVALVCGLLGAGAALRSYRATTDELLRRQTRRVAAQLLPCVAAGAVVTACLLRGGAGLAVWLPGLWATLFGLGLVAARPYLPRLIGAVALFYLAAGALLLAHAPAATTLSGWQVGAPFGAGHLLAALVLHLDRGTADA
jgi:hypothetical protein